MALVLALPAAGFLVRLFIILHDCGHGSFSSSARVNALVGYACGILTFSSFPEFRRTHAIHHATVGNLDRRGVGDVWTMTLGEYGAASPGRKALYRLVRNPFSLFLVLAPLSFLVLSRFPSKGARKSAVLGTLATDLAIVAIVITAALTVGMGRYLMIQLPIIYLASIAGVWLFFIQHQYEGVYWRRGRDWERMEACLLGSSHYDLPPLLRWFSGNIGYHHLHHLDPRIPSYRLKECYEAVPSLRDIKPIGLAAGFGSLRLALYDEAGQELVSFRKAKARLLAEPGPGMRSVKS
jgi:omega-6 fatty acid desaturase (delta-12 desaturase)